MRPENKKTKNILSESYFSASAAETKRIAAHLAKKIWKAARPATVLLMGNLGSGKTTFAQGFAHELGIKKRLVSPSFVIARRYSLKQGFSLWHADFYRLNSEEAENIDFTRSESDQKEIWLIEWPKKKNVKKLKNLIKISFSAGERPNERKINIKYFHNAE